MVTRPTATVPLTLDAHSGERAAWGVLAAKERSLAAERERATTPAARGAVTRRINATRTDMDALAATIQSGVAVVTVEALPRGKYRDILKAHPPRDDDPIDQELGYNTDTFGAALIRAASLSAKTLDDTPVPLDVDTWLDDTDGVAEGEFRTWFRATLNLQTQAVDQVPPLRAS